MAVIIRTREKTKDVENSWGSMYQDMQSFNKDDGSTGRHPSVVTIRNFWSFTANLVVGLKNSRGGGGGYANVKYILIIY